VAYQEFSSTAETRPSPTSSAKAGGSKDMSKVLEGNNLRGSIELGQ